MTPRRINQIVAIASIFAALGLATPAYGQSIDPTIEQSSLFGIGKEGGKLWRYDFGSSSLSVIGNVRRYDTQETLIGIEASAYFQGFQQIHAFWYDSTDKLSKVLHIDTETAEAGFTGIHVGEGKVRGATTVVGEGTVTNPDGTQSVLPTWRVYALQDNPEPDYPPAVKGMVNINPRNNPNYDFQMQLGDGSWITRETLHKREYTIDENGVVYEGTVVYILIRPQGQGNQNSMVIGGEPYNMDNSTTITIESDTMTAKLFNSHIKGAQAMGDWWLEMEAETATITDDGVQVITPPEPWVPSSRLLALHTETGMATTVMQLENLYLGGLATFDGQVFFATTGDELWRIEPDVKSESFVGTLAADQVLGLSFCGSTLMGFEIVGRKLLPINAMTGDALGSPANLGSIGTLGTIIFMPTEEIPKRPRLAFD